MEPVLVGGAVVCGLAYSLWKAHQDAGERLEMWREIAAGRKLLEVEGEARWMSAALRARAAEGPLVVRFEEYARGKRGVGTRLSIEGVTDRVHGLTLRPEGLGTAFDKRMGVREIEIGDLWFDEAFFVGGPPALVRALLDDGTRKAFGALEHETGFELLDGELRADVPGRPEEPPISRVLDALLVVARRLARERDVVGALADNALTDSQGPVRLSCLALLVSEHPNHATTQTVLRAACSDRWLEIRLRAGLAMGEEGRATLLDIASGLADDGRCAQAVAGLGVHLPRERAQELLAEALTRRCLLTAVACVGRVAQDSNAEAPLLGVLARAEKGEGDVRVAVAQALGRVGTVAASDNCPGEAPLNRDWISATA